MSCVGGVGNVNVDLIYTGAPRVPRPGEEVYAKDFGMYLGGGIPATLVNLGRLGVESKVMTFLGNDQFSAFARREFEAAGAQVVNLYHGNGIPVVITSVMVVDGDRAFMSWGHPPAIDGETREILFEALRGADVVPMPPGDIDLYRRLKREGVRLVFDTGWEDDLSVEKYADYLSVADFYLPNRAEAMKITGADSPEAAAKTLERWLPCPVVKLDGEGCLYRRHGATRVVPAVPGVNAVDTTGAGDAFMAGFIYGMVNNCDVEICIQYGNITGAACVKAVGCLTGYVTGEELLDRKRKVYG